MKKCSAHSTMTTAKKGITTLLLALVVLVHAREASAQSAYGYVQFIRPPDLQAPELGDNLTYWDGNFNSFSGSGHDPYGLGTNVTADVLATLINGDDPTVAAKLTQSGPLEDAGGNYYEWQAQTLIQYTFTVTGPKATTIPLMCECEGSATATKSPTARAIAEATLAVFYYTPGPLSYEVGLAYDRATSQSYTGATGSFNQSTDIMVPARPPDDPSIDVQVQLIATVSTVSGTSAVAYVDPIFYIDPTFPDASQYTLTFSDGIKAGSPGGSMSGGTSAAEPATLGLMGLGLAAVALGRRKRKY